MEKQEKFNAIEVLTPAQKEWDLKKRNKHSFESAIKLMDNVQGMFYKNRERRLKAKNGN